MQLRQWQLKVIENVKRGQHKKTLERLFPGFRPAVEACYFNWEEAYPLPGVTYRPEAGPVLGPSPAPSAGRLTQWGPGRIPGAAPASSCRASCAAQGAGGQTQGIG